MPARRRALDPTRSDLEAFAKDLRALGSGKAPIPHIAKHSPGVSRAALYAALSGQRVPSARTLSTLLRWWIAGSASNKEADEDDWEEDWGEETDKGWAWDWVDRLPSDHPGREMAYEWGSRRDWLIDERDGWCSERAEPATIGVPAEQQRFIESLRQVLKSVGILDDDRRRSHWEDRRWAARRTQRIRRYLDGECIPTEASLIRLLEGVRTQDITILLSMAEGARAARVRDRRIARIGRSSAQPDD